MNFDPRTEYQDTQTAEEYDRRRFTSFSGRLFQLCERRALERVLSSVTLGSLLVDAPCGTGRLMPLYLSKGFRVLGVDISREMIHVARRRTASWKGKANFSRLDFARIPLATDSVDAVFCIRFLPHFPPEERIEMLREFSRIARERVVISLSISNGWMRFRRKLNLRSKTAISPIPCCCSNIHTHSRSDGVVTVRQSCSIANNSAHEM